MPRGLLHQNELKGVLLPPWCSHQHRREGIAKSCPRTTPRTASPCRSRRRRVTRLKRGSTCPRATARTPPWSWPTASAESRQEDWPRSPSAFAQRASSPSRSTTAISAYVCGGQPREALSVPRQREDDITVIGWAVEQPYVDRRNIIACWARPFAGMHIVELAVADTRLVAAVAQAPADRRSGRSDNVHTQERDLAVRTGPARPPRLLVRSPADLHPGPRKARGPVHRRHTGRPVWGKAHDPEGWDAVARSRRRTVAAQLLLASARTTRRLRAYTVTAGVPEADSIAPVPAALEVARKAPGSELFRSTGGHYDVYEGGAGFADVLRTEVDFLHRHAKTAA